MPGLLSHQEIRAHIEKLLIDAQDPVQKGILLVLLDIANSINAATTEFADSSGLLTSVKTQLDEQGNTLRTHMEEDVRRYSLVRGGYIVASIVATLGITLLAWALTGFLNAFSRMDDRIDKNSDTIIVNSQRLLHLEKNDIDMERRVVEIERRMGTRQ